MPTKTNHRRWVTAALIGNLQGDITGLIDENGEMWVEFTYDAYGMPQIHVPGAPDNTLAQAVQAAIGLMLTPQLYRGYVYAAVGEMYTYYLGSRYYVPQLCRFFNADKHSDTQTGVLATNMFAYCNNNPVMHVDPTGEALAMPKIFELLNTFIELIRNLFSRLDLSSLSDLINNSSSSSSDSSLNKDCYWPTGRPHVVDDYPYYKSSRALHSGTDIVEDEGTPIYASMSGTVVLCIQDYHNWQNFTNTPEMKEGTPSWGNVVGIQLDSDKTVVIYYAHQQKNSVVKINQHVEAGELIGYVGNTGYSTGPHLHYQARKNGTNVNPTDYLPKE